ncbi:MAG: NUDIX hydrolase [Candidatus Accumulibacter sp.]|uniref:NUDIX hydrolase n=1 Tax=Accumulibacter sp. TaxID=2053492 RepID=UPI0028781D10|nr:NUDIX hydrolase [Accumulibacter sp.]MDS4014816.1 NUDIX hydrolase [Accumulibacter sp.]
MNFCSQCGGAVSLTTPPDDNLPRHVCTACGTIHYLNPKLVVGCIVEWEGRILLCRRSIEPRYGLWTLPAGFMENGETAREAAQRETLEEARAHVEIDDAFALISVPHVNQVHLFYRARLLEASFSPGLETLETALFAEEAIPWREIAFQTVTLCLRAFFSDRAAREFHFHEAALPPVSGRI